MDLVHVGLNFSFEVLGNFVLMNEGTRCIVSLDP